MEIMQTGRKRERVRKEKDRKWSPTAVHLKGRDIAGNIGLNIMQMRDPYVSRKLIELVGKLQHHDGGKVGLAHLIAP